MSTSINTEAIKPISTVDASAELLRAIGGHDHCLNWRFRRFLENHSVSQYILADLSDVEKLRLARAIDQTLAMPE
jgi:hypothetical protein